MNPSTIVRLLVASAACGALSVGYAQTSRTPATFGDPVPNYERASEYTLVRFIDGDAKSVTWKCSTPGAGKRSLTRLYGWYEGTIESDKPTSATTKVSLHQIGAQSRKMQVRLRVDPQVEVIGLVEKIVGARPRTLRPDSSGFYDIMASTPTGYTDPTITYELTFKGPICKVECYFAGWAPDHWPDFTTREYDDGGPPPPSLDGEH